MSEIVCPECGKADLVGLWERRERCVDVPTGKVVADLHVQDAYLSCGYCNHEWDDADVIREARAILGKPWEA